MTGCPRELEDYARAMYRIIGNFKATQEQRRKAMADPAARVVARLVVRESGPGLTRTQEKSWAEQIDEMVEQEWFDVFGESSHRALVANAPQRQKPRIGSLGQFVDGLGSAVR